MNKVIISIAAMIAVSFIIVSCSDKPLKREDIDPEILKDILYNTDESILPQTDYEETSSKEQIKTESDETAPIDDTEEPEVIDTHVYTGDELNDKLIENKLVGYWETGEFGYIRGYRFFESGFLQLILQRKVNQTGIYLVKYGGVYFSVDNKTWDEDVLVIDSISHDEIIGRFGDNVLVLRRADENLVEENSGDGLEETKNSNAVIDASSETKQGVSVN